MADSVSIEKKPKLRPSEDYAFLRDAGMEHLENLGSKLWTDYNIHDPGITILEMLCYAITDLGYRTSYDIKDLLALKKGDGYFHTAREILTVNPTTINDYRKLLIDVEGVQNAWLNPTSENEIPIYLDMKEARLTYYPEASQVDCRVFLEGIYNVLLEFEEDEEYGDLNDPIIKRKVRIEGEDVELEFQFPSWLELYQDQFEYLVDAFLKTGTITNVEVKQADIVFDDAEKAYRLPLKISFDYPEPPPKPKADFRCMTDMPLKEIEETELELATDPEIKHRNLTFEILVRYPGLANIYEAPVVTFLEDNLLARVVDFYRQKIAMILDIVERVRCRLMNHRNLSEDFLKISSLITEEIAVCADIELTPEADVEQVMARIIFELSNFISPPIHFYTIQELFEQGQTADQIFNGPALDHGFIKNSELDKAILIKEIHTSDIINILMDIPGVRAVSELQVANWIEGDSQTDGEPWILKLKGDGLHVPKFSTEKSRLLFFKDVLPFRADMNEVEGYLAEIYSRERRGRLKETPLDLEVPEGTDMEVENYSSFQDDFPLTYGIGPAGIPGNPDDKRKAQARQLQAYLLFYEQILANYMSQLGHVRELFSMEMLPRDRTYFTQVVKSVRDVGDLYTDFDENPIPPKNAFDDVGIYVNEIAEDELTYTQRKNRFLDHLLARFSENFSEYVLLMYGLRKEKAAREIIEDKQLFLKDYPALSRDRGKAFNYRPRKECKECNPEDLWNTDNVSGFKKRVSRLMGIEGFLRGNLTCHCFDVRKIDYTTREDVWVWELCDWKNPDKILLTSIEYESEGAARFMITYAIAMVEAGNLFVNKDNEYDRTCCDHVDTDDLRKKKRKNNQRSIVLLNPCKDVIACSKRYTSKQDPKPDVEKIQKYVMDFCNVEGFHLVEHILLRPRYLREEAFGVRSDELLPICVDGKTGESLRDELMNTLDAELFIDDAGKYRFNIRNQQGDIVMRSQSYDELGLAKNGIESVADNILSPSRYRRFQSEDGRYYFELVALNEEIVGSSDTFATPQDREAIIKSLQNWLSPEIAANKSAAAGSACEICPGDEDPYSFRMSVVLPAWAGRFKDINFRQLVEKTLRLECPAHIHLRICWIDRDQMAEFECAYLHWLLAIGDCEVSWKNVAQKLNDLIDILFHLRNIYPTATLHGCDDDSGSGAQVVLNYSSLGTL